MTFEDIVGNNRIKKILKRALQRKRLPNSLLFVGPAGVGKKDIALVLAGAMNCLSEKDLICESCSSCQAVQRGKFPDVMVIEPEKDVLKIEQMRELKQAAYLKPMVGQKRVFIVDNAEKMNEEAANSLLKILEEPPSFSHIILITSNPFLILPTIRSRCQTLTFSPVLREDIEKVLVDKGQIKDRARVISLLVRGNLKQAMQIEWEEVKEKRQQAWQIFTALINRKNVASILKEYSARRRSAVEEDISQYLEIITSFCRDLLLIKEGGDHSYLMNPDLTEGLEDMAGRLNVNQSLHFLKTLDTALYEYQRNLNLSLLVSTSFMHIMEWKNV